MEGDYIKIKESLLPLSWLYGAAVGMRNFCFDVGLLKSQAFSVPVIAVGNITVGGTGKTPHVEYLVRLLRQKFHVAVLSRGYKRKTSGYLLATNNSTVNDIGDEPLQMKRKFPDISVAVDKKRVRGIQQLTDNDEQLDVVLLDDAFQHRYVKPGINILLVDYHRLIIYDKLLPAGRLRETVKSKNRADIVIVTKCPKSLKPMEFRVITKAMNLYPYQHLFFTTLHYADLHPVFAQADDIALNDLKDRPVLLLTGIASPRQLQEDLAPYTSNITPMAFADHHDFSRRDVQQINDTFAQMSAKDKLIVTTEKDVTRLLLAEGLSDEVRQHLYVLPVDIQFMQDEQAERFNDIITGYVRKNSRNSTLVTGKEEHRPRNDKPSSNKPHTITFK
ncbi:MAG: tetraacyldisaccharide 4'-kinase [Prevotella sp.]|nr:tetraacyldisaccharide 4'-kinase [Prevotella sp.]